MISLEIFSERKVKSGKTEVTYLICPDFKEFIKKKFSLKRWNNKKFDLFMKEKVFKDLEKEKVDALYFKGKIV